MWGFKIETIIQQLLNGLTVGGIYALIALGYTMVYGILKLINFAHGDIFMVGAFLGLFAARLISDNFIVAVLIAMVFSGVLGVFVERVAYRPLRDNSPKVVAVSAIGLAVIILTAVFSKGKVVGTLSTPAFWIVSGLFCLVVFWLIRGKIKGKTQSGNSRINALISAIGMSIVIANMIMLINGPSREVYPKMLPTMNFSFGELKVSFLQVFIIIFSFFLMFILYFLIHKTKFGLAIRAVSHDLNTARLMGINPNKTISLTFLIGSMLAGIAGVLVGTYYNIADPNIGMLYGLKAFVAAVLGGIGSIPGAVVGGIVLGVVEVMGVAFISPSFRDAIAFGILIFILVVRPTGIFGKKMKEKV